MQRQFHNQNGQHCRWWHHPSSSWSVPRWWFHCILLMWQRSVPGRQLLPWSQLHTLSNKEQANDNQSCFQLHRSSDHNWAKWLIGPVLISGFCSMKGLGVFLLPPPPPTLDGLLVHSRVPPSIKFANINFYTSVEGYYETKKLPKNTTVPPWIGLKPRLPFPSRTH